MGRGGAVYKFRSESSLDFFFPIMIFLPMRINMTCWMKSVHPMLEVVYSQRRPVADSAHRYHGDMSAPKVNIPRNCGGAT